MPVAAGVELLLQSETTGDGLAVRKGLGERRTRRRQNSESTRSDETHDIEPEPGSETDETHDSCPSGRTLRGRWRDVASS